MHVKPGITLLALIAGAVLAAATVSCNKGGDTGSPQSAAPAQAPEAAAPGAAAEAPATSAAEAPQGGAIDGKAVYARANCTMCHGQDLSGSNLAPALTTLRANWTAETLKQYLADPLGYAESDQRLAEQIKQYPTMKMPAWGTTGLGDADRDALVDWLLTQ